VFGLWCLLVFVVLVVVFVFLNCFMCGCFVYWVCGWMVLLKRVLGRTGLEVSVVGFGGTWLCELGVDESVGVVRRAFDLGVNYFDTARWDGDSEDKLGVALEGVRDECVLATKTGLRTRRESVGDLEESLRRLRTDRVDLIQLHGIDDVKTLGKAMGAGGVLETCKEARSRGLVDFIGISSHKPHVLVKAMGTGEFDVVLVPLNVVTRQALEEVVPIAEEYDVGVVAMKPFFAKTSKLVTCLYRPSLSLLSDEAELHDLLGLDRALMAQNALRFVLAQDVSVVIAGMRSVEEVEVNAKVGEEFAGLTAAERQRFEVQFNGDYCRDCGVCLPCPREVDVGAVLRFHLLYEVYGLKGWAKKLYGGLQVKADRCDSCKECEFKCLYGLPVVSMLRRAHQDLAS
jgi:uncharacterized protein